MKYITILYLSLFTLYFGNRVTIEPSRYTKIANRRFYIPGERHYKLQEFNWCETKKRLYALYPINKVHSYPIRQPKTKIKIDG